MQIDRPACLQTEPERKRDEHHVGPNDLVPAQYEYMETRIVSSTRKPESLTIIGFKVLSSAIKHLPVGSQLDRDAIEFSTVLIYGPAEVCAMATANKR